MTEGWGKPALFEHAPAVEGRIPWVPLGNFPTPLERMRIETPDGAREILVKREDLSAVPYGGNKVRKLEFILAEARARGAKRLITVGAAGSHHALATTVYGRRLGFDISLILFPQKRTPHVRRVLLLDAALGAELRFTSRMEGVPFALALARIAHRGEGSFVIEPGGSDAIGTLGWVSAGLELAQQLIRQRETPKVVHVAAGTMGTAAGLALGLVMGGRPVPIVASRITSRIVTNRRVLENLMEGVAAILEPYDVAVPAGEAARLVDLRDDQLGIGYGHSTPAADAANEIFTAAGLPLDITYTAKAAAALLADPTPALFVHTLSATEPDVPGLADVTLPPPFARYLEAP